MNLFGGKHTQPLFGYKLLALISFEFLIAFSNIGYIVIPPVSITLMDLPVLIGALSLGPAAGALAGGVFGLTSMWKATASANLYGDIIFSPFLSGQPVGSLILSIGTRVFYGLFAGLLYSAVLRYRKHKKTDIFLVSLAARIVHTACVFGAMQYFFPETGVTLGNVLPKLCQPNTIVSILFNFAVILLFYSISQNRAVQTFERELAAIQHKHTQKKNYWLILGIFCSMILLGISLVRHYFARIMLLLGRYDIVLPDDFRIRFIHIGAQFMVSMIFLSCLITVLFVLFETYSSEMAEKSKRELMTGLYNKNAIIQIVNSNLSNPLERNKGYFIVLDIDDFKSINDNYGHPFGDQVLIYFAQLLENTFDSKDKIGRLGGDEFCVYSYHEAVRENILSKIESMCNSMDFLTQIDQKDVHITCSFGVTSCEGKEDFSHVYAQADKALYLAKQSGKNQYVVYHEKGEA